MRLTANLRLLLIVSTTFILFSCQKEMNPLDPVDETGNNPGGGTGNTSNIAGEYNFVGHTANSVTSVTVSDQGMDLEAVTTSNYITKNNVGTVNITASDISFIGVGYSVDTMINLKTYLDGTLFDDSDLPFVASFPPTNTAAAYTRINSDSLNVVGAIGIPGPSGVTPTGTVGLKLSWSGDTLLLTIKSPFTQTVMQGGVPATITGYANGVSRLKKR